MKLKMMAFMGCLFLLFLTSCSNQKNELISTTSDSNTENIESNNSTVVRYDVYKQWGTNIESDEFNIAMDNNAIDEKMEHDLQTQDISTTSETLTFFDYYLEIWKSELSFSINNLKKYLSNEEIVKLETAQMDWEEDLKSNSNFDYSLIVDNGLDLELGMQYKSSLKIYVIEQYRTRVCHIKYMTYLLENHLNDGVPQQEQSWSKFHEFT